MSRPPNRPNGNGAPLDRAELLELQLRHLSDADLERLARAIVREHGQRRREARDMRRDNPRVRFWRPCPICGSTACVSKECRMVQQRMIEKWGQPS